jgi:hypothetical protein
MMQKKTMSVKWAPEACRQAWARRRYRPARAAGQRARAWRGCRSRSTAPAPAPAAAAETPPAASSPRAQRSANARAHHPAGNGNCIHHTRSSCTNLNANTVLTICRSLSIKELDGPKVSVLGVDPT